MEDTVAKVQLPALANISPWRAKGALLAPLQIAETPFQISEIPSEGETDRSVATPRQCSIAFLVGEDNREAENVTSRAMSPARDSINASNNEEGHVRDSSKEQSANIFVYRTGEITNYGCGICSRLFRVKRDLRQHIKCVHEKIRPFECPQCNKRFSIKPNLKRHILTVHEKLRPYSCTHCGKAFGLRENYEKHVKMVHEKRKPLRCSQCSRDFTTKGSLQRHLDAYHRNQEYPRIGLGLDAILNA
mmetsp:Transcript_29068/g.113034  ORF Transcript_29068/g.113034 Transcript_29068/m.113034 type:complete len:246 (-) Transcript_29068:95-832(-)|eukprot:CAMPEP_0113962730 /NCGR_PEP_ID=MMETSP0011_2-20120614/6093_1 /TAXON_ID=101924 /ORGANISM="Rhodosorus marinus" /LENGTH=245 /DNA_ID=CAMNT_0000974647 /DNA_START=49 /DNA_END=786 /DNA_ORIENTATION=+ /assembly_acc=CAM_ASM_000156